MSATMESCALFVCLALFLVLVVWGAFKSWLLGRVLRARPHQRPCPTTTLHPCMLLSAVQLSKKLESGELSSPFVTDCYIRHIELVNPFLNAVVYELFDEARAQALAADAKWKEWRKSPGTVQKPHWLNGVPCTIKECISVKGCPNTSGHPKRRHVVSQTDAPTVARLRRAGCVFLGITNISELCMWMESNNKVYGITCNPYDTRRLVGGSSGGEGASVASCFAPFGLGSDVGGSIRMPSFFCGLYGYKASSHLIPNRNQHPGARGRIHHMLATGPICRYAEDILPISLVLSEGGFVEDVHEFHPPTPLPTTLPMLRRPSESETNADKSAASLAGATDASDHNVALRPTRGRSRTSALDKRDASSNVAASPPAVSLVVPVGSKRLRVFAITDMGIPFVSVAPSEQAAVLRVAKQLREGYGADVTVLNFRTGAPDAPPGWEGFRDILAMWAAHITEDSRERSFIDFMSEGLAEGSRLKPFREYIKWLAGLSSHTGMAIGLCLIERIEELSGSLGVEKKKRDLVNGHNFRMALQRELGDDAIIVCPTYPYPAPKHHEPTWYPFQWQYTAAFNLSRLPAINIPVWDEDIGTHAPSYSEARRAALPEDHHIPKGVQIVAAWGNDALALAVVGALEKDGVCGYRLPPWALVPSA